jgi:hypothetical protein
MTDLASSDFEYFARLFSIALDEAVLRELWCESQASMRGDSAEVLYYAIDLAAARLERDEAENDFELACRLQKAERRRESKRRSKQKKKALTAPIGGTQSSAANCLSQRDKAAYRVLCEVLGNSKHIFGDNVIIGALLDCGGDANVAAERLLFGDDLDSAAHDGPGLQAHQTIAHEARDHGPPPPATLPSMRTSHVSNEQLLIIQPLLDHCLRHLRSRNPGVQVVLEQDFLLFKGTQRPLARTDSPTELLMDIDLHGIMRKPAVDILQSSLLYYYNLLGTKALDAMCSRDECAVVAESNGSRRNRALQDLGTTIKCITIVYVVGQGVHSPGAVPILRNTFMRELDEYWSMFEHGIDASNEGQIFVKVRRLK